MGLQVGEKADPGPTYFGAVWDGVGGGFGWNLLDGSALLSASALVFCSTVEIIIISCGP